MRKMDETMLIGCIELPLHKESDFSRALDIAMSTKKNEKDGWNHADWLHRIAFTYIPTYIYFTSPRGFSVKYLN